MNSPHASVIIPTYNRPDRLSRLLESLAAQTLPPINYEVIVVDDGSDASYEAVVSRPWPFRLRHVCQENAGEAVARNTGVARASGGFIVFLDDDMTVVPDYLAAMLAEHRAHPDAILLGNMLVPPEPNGSTFQRVKSSTVPSMPGGPVPFTEMAAGVMALPCGIYVNLDGMKPFANRKRGGWMDLAFAFRAYQAGYRFRRCGAAVAHHHDYTVLTREAGAQRMYNTSRFAPALFEEVPDLEPYVTMYRDMKPIDWRQDPLSLKARKIARATLASGPSLRGMEAVCAQLEARYPKPRLLRPLYRWILGAYIFRGYRDGLKELARDD